MSFSLAKSTSFRIGGRAAEFYEPQDPAELASVLSTVAGRDAFLLGGGCNTLFPDGEFQRPVVSTVRMRRIEIDGDRIYAECGVRIGTLVGKAIEAGLSGLEGFVGIPGTVGGAVAMNAGGVDAGFGDCVESLGLVRLADGRLEERDGRDVPWTYRSWNVLGYAVAWARLRLGRSTPKELRSRARDCFFRKRNSQPLSEWSAGCIFKNPPGHSAARLIDELGLKGLRRGGAEVSTTHANFIVNRDDATAEDVCELIAEIQRRVWNAHAIELKTEIVLPSECAQSARARAFLRSDERDES